MVKNRIKSMENDTFMKIDKVLRNQGCPTKSGMSTKSGIVPHGVCDLRPA